MPFVLLAVGILFFIVAIQGTQGGLFALLKSEFVGTNSFVVWAAALVIIGLLGYIKPIRPISHAFLVLILLVLVLSNGKGFFSQFNAAIRSPVAPSVGSGAQPAAGAPSLTASSVPQLTTPATQTPLPQVY